MSDYATEIFSGPGLSILAALEEDTYKLEVARKICNSKEAEMRLVRTLLAEARAAVASRQAEIELAKAASNLIDAELQIGVIRHRINKQGRRRLSKNPQLNVNLAEMLLSRPPSKTKPALFKIM
ncbi:hypothetical protein B0H13DRAFT_2317347 [Mycena leptocephala]|nr:hypothetical protein B0H13DRAFT_2317347 [Mycena leptocephala]